MIVRYTYPSALSDYFSRALTDSRYYRVIIMDAETRILDGRSSKTPLAAIVNALTGLSSKRMVNNTVCSSTFTFQCLLISMVQLIISSTLSLLHSVYVYTYTYVHVCVCVCMNKYVLLILVI